jgi:hypothetical protein
VPLRVASVVAAGVSPAFGERRANAVRDALRARHGRCYNGGIEHERNRENEKENDYENEHEGVATAVPSRFWAVAEDCSP